MCYGGQEEALDRAAAEPETLDAIITFDTGANDGDVSYTIRGNHTELPSTRLTYNEFDLLPDPQYRMYWLFANIQQALDRSAFDLTLCLSPPIVPLYTQFASTMVQARRPVPLQ